MQKIPTVSIIIPTFNRDNLVCRAIDSAINQTYREKEIIVIDDGSSDLTADILIRKYDNKIRFICQDNRGVADARNRGIREAQGDYLAFLDSDDIWMPLKLQTQMKKFKTSPDVGLIYCGYTILNHSGELLQTILPLYRGMIYNKMMSVNHIGGASVVVVKRECVEKVGFFRSKYSPAEDYDYWIRICKKYQVDFVEDPLVKYIVHSGGISQNKRQMEKGVLNVLRDNLHENGFEHNCAIKRDEVFLNHFKRWAKAYLQQGEPDDFKRCFVNFLKYETDETFPFDNGNLKLKVKLTKDSINEYLRLHCPKHEVKRRKRQLYLKYYKIFAYIFYNNGEMQGFRRCFMQVIRNDSFSNFPRNLFNYLKSFLGKEIADTIHKKLNEICGWR